MIVPWSTFWDRNYFAEAWPVLRGVLGNNFVRGAVSGLGVVNIYAGVVELVLVMTARQQRGAPVE